MNSNYPILFYDGYCGLCSWSVQFVMHHESKKEILFAPLQSSFAANFLAQYGLSTKSIDTVVFYEKKQIYTQSKAIFKITKYPKYPFRLLMVFKILPKFVTDEVYNLIARSRYFFWKRKSSCYIIHEDKRFI